MDDNSKRFYDATAKLYSSRHDNDTGRYIRKRESAMVKKYVQGRAVDVGCGTGYHMNAERIGIDISHSMLMECKSSKNLSQAKAEELPIKTGAFDSAICMFSTLNLCDSGRAAEEMGRILKNKGVAIVSVSGVRDSGKKTKNMRIEGFRMKTVNFAKKELIELFRKNGFELLEFRGLFKMQRPYWGWHRDFSLIDKTRLLLDRILPGSMGRMYIAAFRKLK